MHALSAIVGAIAPVVLLLALGALLARVRLLTAPAAAGLGDTLYFVVLPAQLVVLLAAADVRRDLDLAAFLAAGGAFVFGALLAALCARGLKPDQRGSAVNGASRANGAFIGLPVIVLLSDSLPPDSRAQLATAYAVLLAVMVPLFNLTAVLAFRLPHATGVRGLAAACAELPRNPILIGCTLGVGLSLLAPGCLESPDLRGAFWNTVLHLLAACGIPLALLVTGARLDLAGLREHRRTLAWASALKLLVIPALGLGCSLALGLDREALCAVVVLSACPAAMASVPMARQLGGDPGLMSALVAVTTLLSPFTMFVWLVAMR